MLAVASGQSTNTSLDVQETCLVERRPACRAWTRYNSTRRLRCNKCDPARTATILFLACVALVLHLTQKTMSAWNFSRIMKTTRHFVNRLIHVFLGSMHQVFGVVSDISSRYPGSGHKAHDHLLFRLIFSIKKCTWR